MIRAFLVMSMMLLAPAGFADAKEPRFKSAPGASGAEKREPKRDRRRFKPAPGAAKGSDSAKAPVAAQWLPERPADAKPLPFEWADSLKRCLQSVAANDPMNEQGMLKVGDRVLDYQQPYTRQTWLHGRGTVAVNYQIEAGFGNTPSRNCVVVSVKGRSDSLDSAQLIEDGFLLWAYDLIEAGQYRDAKHPDAAGQREGNAHFALISKAGNARRCRVRIRYSKKFFGDKAEIAISIAEDAQKPCSQKRGQTGGV